MLGMFKKKAADPESESEEEEEQRSPRESGVAKKDEYDLDLEADGDDTATAASVVQALYAKYRKNVRVCAPTTTDLVSRRGACFFQRPRIETLFSGCCGGRGGLRVGGERPWV